MSHGRLDQSFKMTSEDIELYRIDEATEEEPFLSSLREPEIKPLSASVGANDEFLDYSLPPRGNVLRFTRWTIFGVYRRLFMTVFIFNAYHAHKIITMQRKSKYSPLLVDISTAAAANMLAAILIRQEYILNSLFRVCWFVPHATPLRIRRSIAKIYEYGGFHSSTAICSVLYFSLLSAILAREWMTFRIVDPLIIACSLVVMVILWTMVIVAYPTIRAHRHNTFEMFHRFGGWIVLAVFWPELWLFTRALGHQAGPVSPGAILHKLPAFWLLIISCFHVALPWMRLRRIQIRPERLGVGVHAIRLHLKEKVKNCVVYRIADSPLTEWHAFACIPEPNGEGGSLIVSVRVIFICCLLPFR